MFGFFKNKNKTKKPASVNSEPASPNEVLATLNRLQKELDRLKLAVSGGVIGGPTSSNKVFDKSFEEVKDSAVIQKNGMEKVIEGVFDGQNMIGADGSQYDVPPNYASKSKLVEGDILKLTINNLGSFIYKQIKPIDRLRMVGVLEQDPHSLQYFASEGERKWKLITASVTYFKGEVGDEIVFLIPAEGESRFAAVENIIKK